MGRRILNHDIMNCTAEGVLGNHLYSGRAVGISDPEDVVMLHPALEADWDALCAHYERIGLSHSRQLVWDVCRERLREFPDHQPSVFFFGAEEHQMRPDSDWHGAVASVNCKNAFMTHAERLGVPVPVTRCFEDAQDIGEDAIATTIFPCYLKASVSVSGVGIFRCQDADALRRACGEFAPGTPVQIQREVKAESFLNLQYINDNGQVERLAATEQVLDGYVHQGNRHPAAHAPWEMVDPLADWLGETGMRGVFAFDVAVVREPAAQLSTGLSNRLANGLSNDPAKAPAADANGVEYLAIECNPRFNGASYPTLVADKLGVSEWLAIAFGTRHRCLADLDLNGLEYNPDTGTGVVLVNWGPIQVGKFLALLAGDRNQQEMLATELGARL
ncbi:MULTISPECIES: ATP-grasp domain-containing protein [Thiorhodovibrio]|uniref:ATP-grasp domain-containing protein n=1 Tax=Thiorhodovibrio TaxID=61593 RepID=UPI00191174E3|nr:MULTISPECIES: ATP-grasp domain-containing protein [Thiorhodovibrio]MBK5968440.1 ATP-grasp domain-containing protein [Thiorhodovibrio winogradskyi]WPL11080.1 putative ATP-grasp enzyme [Thiorhodovibrio litoralis]